MRIATWNVNGIKSRIENVLQWLESRQPDVACLQEIKSVDENFPRLEIEALGYNVETHGQKSFNGVALLSKRPLEDVMRGLPGDETDEQARYIEATVSTDNTAIRVASLYLPNGNPPDTEKYPYKLGWMDRLATHARTLLDQEMPLVLAGDYNIIPDERDAKNIKNWLNDALHLPESREKFEFIKHLGLTEAYRVCDDADGAYTFWDYQAGAWQKNNGIRIDHALLSPEAADQLEAVEIDKDVRGWEKPSDHVPVIVTLAA
jgi:exodeoxyribonuclease-3